MAVKGEGVKMFKDMKIQAILAKDENDGIGFEGGILKHVAVDLAFFSGFTQSKCCIVGYNTYQTLPKLANRIIKLDGRNMSAETTLNMLDRLNYRNIVVIGGAKTYNKYSKYTQEMFVTTFKDWKSEVCDTYIDMDMYNHLTGRQEVYKNKEIVIDRWYKE